MGAATAQLLGLRAIVGRYQETDWDSVITVMWHVLNLQIECAVVRYPGEDHPGHEARQDSVIMVGVMVLQILTEIVEMVGMSDPAANCRADRGQLRLAGGEGTRGGLSWFSEGGVQQSVYCCE